MTTQQQQLLNSPTFMAWADHVATQLGIENGANLMQCDAGLYGLLIRCNSGYPGEDQGEMHAALEALTPEPEHRILRTNEIEYRIYPDESLYIRSNGEDACWWDIGGYIAEIRSHYHPSEWDAETRQLAEYYAR